MFLKITLNLYIIQFFINYFEINNKNKLNTKNNLVLNINTQYNIFLYNKKNFNKINVYLNFQAFNSYYLKKIFNIETKEKNFNALKLLPKNITKNLIFDLKNYAFKMFNIKYFNEILHMFLINVWLKNTKNICKYIKKNLENIHFKKHRKFFLFYFSILDTFIFKQYSVLQIKGITLKFKGKLGRGGNSRKKTLIFKRGFYSLSNKMLCLNRYKWSVWTKTGSVGCTFQLFYNNYVKFFKYIYYSLFNNIT